jgi:hypothetical protein
MIERQMARPDFQTPEVPEALTRLIQDGKTEADVMYQEHALWHALVDAEAASRLKL